MFQEFFPAGISIHPHVKLTPDILTLDVEERVLFQSDFHKQDIANRLIKLLMIGRMNKIPLNVIDMLKWDLGLPNDYIETIVPEFPDYFKLCSSGNELELVCWSDELAVSVMEKNSMSCFPLQYSRGFEVDNKFNKWVDDWQKLPYVSPYQNVIKSDKWSVGLLHEILHLLVPKKTLKDNLLFLGEYLGVRSMFKRALLQHPGIFYVSSKLNTHTVVLREGYKRDLLVSGHPLMNLRSNYIHLMYMVKEKNKAQVVRAKKHKVTQDSNEGEEDNELSDITSEQEEDDNESDGVIDSEDSNNDRVERNHLTVDETTPTKKKDREYGNTMIRGRTSRTVKFNDSPRRNTPNARGSENDGRRRRGREKTRNDQRTSSRTNQMSDRRVTNRPTFLRTESIDARKARSRSSERSNVSRTKEGRF